MTIYSASLDTSNNTTLAIARDGEIIVEKSLITSGMNNDTILIPWIVDSFKEIGIQPRDVTNWTCGTGPGSYSGIRVGISFVKGICIVSGAQYRGVASSLACAMEMFDNNPSAKTALVIYDGRRNQLIICPFRKENGNIITEEPSVMDKQEAEDLMTKTDIICSLQKEQITSVVSTELIKKITFLDASPAKQFILAKDPQPQTIQEQEDSCEPVYVRPAVFVAPQTIRVI